MIKCVADFLATQWDGKSPLLLGYSGGSDSKALLYTLLEAGCKTLHLAHVDHGWRTESSSESAELKEEAKSLGLPFHTVRLNLDEKGNQEAVARDARYSFFRSLFEKIPFQALLLAHQAGDVAETVLKRFFEGAYFSYLGGMEPISKLEGMLIWRPLLSIKKEELAAYLRAKQLNALVDPTNFDPAYLRARMRLKILPELAKSFGKEIFDNLLLYSQRAFELKEYIDRKTEFYQPSRGPWGLFCHLEGVERLEARYLLLKWAHEEKVPLPRTLLEATLEALASSLPNRRIAPRIVVDRGYLFFLSSAPPKWGSKPLILSEGSTVWGDWMVDVEKLEGKFQETTWKEVWSGRFSALVPRGILMMPPTGTPLRHLWNQKKVPAFFRYQVPFVWNGEGRSKEFLTGKILPEMGPYFKLVISTRSE